MQHQRLVAYIKQQKQTSGLTMAEISRQMGLSDGQLSNMVNGVTPGLKMCRQIADYFNVSLEYILYLAGHIDQPPTEYGLEVERIAYMLSRIADEETRRRAATAATAVLEAFMQVDRAAG